MPDKPVAGDVGGRPHQPKFCKLGANRIDLRHEDDHLFLQRARSHSAFDGRRGDTDAQRLCQHE